MTERKGQFDEDETPEDVASLYSWANLHGAKYRDFSVSRAQTREKARQRLEQAMEEERLRAQQQTGSQRTPENPNVREGPFPPPNAPAAPPAPESSHLDDLAAISRGFAEPPRYRSTLPRTAPFGTREEGRVPPPRNPSPGPDPTEAAGRPAWLMPERNEPASQPGAPAAPEDTLQGSRERLATRWYALRGVFEGSAPPAQAAPAPVARAPVIAVFSLAGGVGKTCLVATLGRALSGRGERVLLVDTADYGLLPFFFGACDQRPGLLRTFNPPASSGDAPIQIITLDPESLGSEASAPEALTGEISKHARGVGRVIIDLATASGATTRRIMRLNPQILVPLIPDMNSVVSVSSIDAFFDHNGGQGKPTLPHYVLNEFDATLPLHLDLREVLREQLGDRLLPFVLRRAPAVSEALAEGMTVMDYAPNSPVAEDFASLAGWVKSLSAPASAGFRGVRWSER